MAETMLASVEKLSGRENYADWKFAMKMVLMHENLWFCVDGYPDDDQTPAKDKTRKEEKALSRICLSVKKEIFPHVSSCKTAKEAWDNLAKAFEESGLSGRLSLLRKLFSIKRENFQSMETYIGEVTATCQKLASIKYPIDDEFIAVIMLNGLPPEFNPLIMALENSGIQKLTSDLVKSRLINEIDRQECHDAALFTRGNAKSKKVVICHHCGIPGHIKPKCPQLRKKKKATSNVKDKSQASSTNVSSVNPQTGASLLTSFCAKVNDGDWYVDSAASASMTNKRSWLTNYSDKNPDSNVTIADGNSLPSKGSGDVRVSIKDSDVDKISNVVYVPNLTTNLLSVKSMVDKDYVVVFHNQKCEIFHQGAISFNDAKPVATARDTNGLYRLDASVITSHSASSDEVTSLIGSRNEIRSGTDSHVEFAAIAAVTDPEIWHRRLGHLSRYGMDLMRQGLVTGMNFTAHSTDVCVPCVEGKLSRQPFKTSGSRASELLGIVHSDVCGPMSCESFSGKRYLLTFTDDFSRKTFGYYLHSKDEVFAYFKVFKAFVENQVDKRIKILRSDGGGEYVNNTMKAYLEECGIKHEITIPHSPQQNGVSERVNRSIIEKTICMLQSADLSRAYWAEACNTAIYLKNRAPHRALVNATPEEIWSGKKPDVAHLRVFGCTALVHIPKVSRKKLDAKTRRCIFVGYCEESKGYRLIDPANPKKIIKSRDVVFVEKPNSTEIPVPVTDDITKSKEVIVEQIGSTTPSDTLDDLEPADSTPPPSDDSGPESDSSSDDGSDVEDGSVIADVGANEVPEVRRYPTRVRKQPDALKDFHLYLANSDFVSELDDPISLSDALSRNDRDKWKEALNQEYDSCMDNQAWSLVDRPTNRKVLKSKWVFKLKRHADGKIEKHKARLVATGYNQIAGVDYNKTFSPVVRHSSVRYLFALAAEKGLKINHFDVENAFLSSKLDETIYMEQPEGFVIKGQEDKVCCLKKSIYGLKQSSRQFNSKVDKKLKALGFRQSSHEACVYFKIDKSSIFIFALYVDDFLAFYNNDEQFNQIKSALMDEFKMKDLGPVKSFLGMNIKRDDSTGEIVIDQKHYILKVLEKFQMSNCNPVATPLEVTKKKQNEVNDVDEGNISSVTYQSLIGALQYLNVCTRPDISYSVSYLSQFNNSPKLSHWKAAKRVLRYLKGTINQSLVFKRTNKNIQGYADADWGGNIIDRRSYSGYVFIFANSPISWASKKQRAVAQSSCEAEYYALGAATKEAQFFRNLHREFFKKKIIIEIFNDSQSAQELSENPFNHERTKHIDIKRHAIRDAVKKKQITLTYLSTKQMPADVLTKALPRVKHEFCVSKLGRRT